MSRRNKKKNVTSSTERNSAAVAESQQTTKDAAATDAADKQVAEASKTNDVEWYAKDPELLLTAAQVPFSDTFGSPVNMYPNGYKFYNYGNVSQSDNHAVEFHNSGANTVTGVMALLLRPTFGYNANINDPLNLAATALYTHVRYNNSGRKNYEQSDLMMYMCAMSELYSYIFWLERIYNCAFMLSQRNYYVGEAWLRAQAINPKEIINNLANFRYRINLLINKVSAFVIPDSIELFKRRAFLYSNIYIDNPDGNIKDQVYMFVPRGFHMFEYDEDNVGVVRYKSLDHYATSGSLDATYEITMDKLLSIGDDMLKNIYGDEDWGLMSGDLLRSFAGHLIGLQSIPEEGIVVPVYDVNVLHQIKNAIPVSEENNFSGKDFGNTNFKYYVRKSLSDTSLSKPCYYGDLYQDGVGNLHSQYLFKAGSQLPGTPPKYSLPNSTIMLPNVIISSDNPMPTPAEVVEFTRLIPTNLDINNRSVFGDNSDSYGLMDPTPEYVCSVKTFHWNYKRDSDGGRVLDKTTYSGNIISSNQDLIDLKNAIFRRLVFHHSPIMYYLDWSVSKADKVEDVLPLSDINNYTVQSSEVISRLNKVAWLSLVYVPGISKMMH